MKLRIILTFLLAISLLSIAAKAEISFGSLQKVKEIEVEIGSLAKAGILVWNSGEEDFNLNFFPTYLPKGWEVKIVPNNFILSKNPEGKVEIIVVGNKQFKAKIVEVYFKPLSYAEAGEAIITAIAKSKGEQISVSQARDFKFILKVKGRKQVEKKFRNLNVATLANKTEESGLKIEVNKSERKEKPSGEGGKISTRFLSFIQNQNVLIIFLVLLAILVGIYFIFLFFRRKKRNVFTNCCFLANFS